MSNLFTFKLFLLITSKSCQWCICVSLQHSEEIFVTKKHSRLVTLCHDFVRNYNLHFIGWLTVIQWKQSELKIQANAEVLSLKWPAEVSQSPQNAPNFTAIKSPCTAWYKKVFVFFKLSIWWQVYDNRGLQILKTSPWHHIYMQWISFVSMQGQTNFYLDHNLFSAA